MEYAVMVLGLAQLVESLIAEFQAVTGKELSPELRAKAKELREAARAAANAVK